MDPYDLEPTPEEQQAALIQAIKLKMGGGGQQPEQADAYRAWGNLGQLTGDRVLAPFGQSQVHQAEAMGRGDGALLMKMLAARKANANSANAANQGMELAVKNQFPQVWQSLSGQGLSDASWGKVYMQENAKDRVHYTQGEVGGRFEKTNALHTEKQAADLGAREVYGANPLDPKHPKPISQAQSEALADMKAAADTVTEKTREAKAIYAKGTPLPGSQEDAYIRQLITETYGPMLKTGNIGNLTDSHLHLLQDMLKNPSGDWRTYFNNKLFPSMLDSLAKAAEDNLEHQARSKGRTFRKSGGSDVGGQQQRPTRTVGNETRVWNGTAWVKE